MAITDDILCSLADGYGWDLDNDGRLLCLVAGDQGYAETGLTLAQLFAAAGGGAAPAGLRSAAAALATAAAEAGGTSRHEQLELEAALRQDDPDLAALGQTILHCGQHERIRTAVEPALGVFVGVCLQHLEAQPRFAGWRDRAIDAEAQAFLVNGPELLHFVASYAAAVKFAQKPERILAIFPYGSRVYGSARPNSDVDLIAVIDDEEAIRAHAGPGDATGDGRVRVAPSPWHRMAVDITLHTPARFAELLARHDPAALECALLPPSIALPVGSRPALALDPQRLRASFSAKASHAFVKARKKIEVEGDLAAGQKSLFHALRLLSFGRCIAESGGLPDFGVANPLLADILATPADWPALQARFKPVYNVLATRFRQAAPKPATARATG